MIRPITIRTENIPKGLAKISTPMANNVSGIEISNNPLATTLTYVYSI